jgi:RNA polymerase sigma factor (sigma-70 family)
MLTTEQENSLVAKAAQGDSKSQNDLLLLHEGFLSQMAWRRWRRDRRRLDQEDLLMAARYGLLEAVKRFDPKRQVKFLSYAGWWIRNFLELEVHNSRLVMVPKYLTDKRNREHHKFREFLERADHVKTLSTISLDEDSPAWEPACQDEAPALEQVEVEQLLSLLNELSVQERLILRLRFWEGLTLKQMGQRLGFTRERARQVQLKALRKLRERLGQPAKRLTDELVLA